MENKPPPFYDDKNTATVPNLKVMLVVLLGIILIWLAFQYRSNGFFAYEGVSLGMSNEEVLELLPDAGKFQKIRYIDQKAGKTYNFELFELKDKLSPWNRYLVGSQDGKVISISAWASKLAPEQVDEIRNDLLSQYGMPDDILTSKYGAETLVWGDVDFNKKDVMQGVKEINGRAILYRFRKPGTVNIYVSRDGDGPKFFF